MMDYPCGCCSHGCRCQFPTKDVVLELPTGLPMPEISGKHASIVGFCPVLEPVSVSAARSRYGSC